MGEKKWRMQETKEVEDARDKSESENHVVGHKIINIYIFL